MDSTTLSIDVEFEGLIFKYYTDMGESMMKEISTTSTSLSFHMQYESEEKIKQNCRPIFCGKMCCHSVESYFTLM